MNLRHARLVLSCASFLSIGCEGDPDNPYADKLAGKGSSEEPAKESSSETTSESTQETETSHATSSDIVGTWALTGSGKTWYGIFSKNGTWVIADDKAGSKVRVYGTYTASHGEFSGPMTNPGIGTGKIAGTYSGDSMTLYFTEYWHDPAKTVTYSGTR